MERQSKEAELSETMSSLVKQAAIMPALFRACLVAKEALAPEASLVDRIKAVALLDATIDVARANSAAGDQ